MRTIKKQDLQNRVALIFRRSKLPGLGEGSGEKRGSRLLPNMNMDQRH